MTKQLDLFTNVEITKIENEEERLPQESELTPRQWALYNLIKHNSLVEHRKTTQREIYEKLGQEFGYEWTESNNTSDNCTPIWGDVVANNLSYEHDKLIITRNYKYWIGSKEENEAFLRKLWKDIAPRLHRYWQYVKKIGSDGQGKIYDKNLNPVDDEESNARFFHECFNDYDVTMQKAVEQNKKADKELSKKQEVESQEEQKHE